MASQPTNYLQTQSDRISMGFFSNDVFAVNKFGANADVGTSEEDIWLQGGTETLLTTAQSLYVSCTAASGADTQEIQISGLDGNWDRQVGYATLDNRNQAIVTAADGSAQTWTRVHRAFQSSAAPDPVGDVYIAESDTLTAGVPDTATKVHAFIDYTNAANQTQKAMYTVPKGFTALIHTVAGNLVEASGGSARSCILALEIAQLARGATTDNPSWTPFRRISEINVSTSGPSAVINYKYPLIVPQMTNIHLRGLATASLSVLGQFQMVVVRDPRLVEGEIL
jgi:hypothetical protein